MKLLDDVWAKLKKRIDESFLTLVILLAVGVIAGFRGRDTVAGVVDEQIQPVRRQADENTQKLKFQAEDIHELGKDVRELYRVVPRVRDSARLEAPFPTHADGGTP